MSKLELHPHQLEILRVLKRESIPISRPQLYSQLSFGNWLGKWLGTPRSPGKYSQSLYELGLVNVEDEGGGPDENGRNCLFFFATKKGIRALEKAKKQNGFNRKSLGAMSRTELRKLAKKHGVSTTGTKADMIGRFTKQA